MHDTPLLLMRYPCVTPGWVQRIACSRFFDAVLHPICLVGGVTPGPDSVTDSRADRGGAAERALGHLWQQAQTLVPAQSGEIAVTKTVSNETSRLQRMLPLRRLCTWPRLPSARVAGQIVWRRLIVFIFRGLHARGLTSGEAYPLVGRALRAEPMQHSKERIRIVVAASATVIHTIPA